MVRRLCGLGGRRGFGDEVYVLVLKKGRLRRVVVDGAGMEAHQFQG